MSTISGLWAGGTTVGTVWYRNQARMAGKEAPEKARANTPAREKSGKDLHDCGDEEVEGAGEISRSYCRLSISSISKPIVKITFFYC